MTVVTQTGVRDGVGAGVLRPDGTLKVRGEFAYSSDLWSDRALWGTTLRSPHASARIRSLDFARALAAYAERERRFGGLPASSPNAPALRSCA